MERIHCIKHEESTPSLVVYSTHAFCYGGCGRIELAELGGKAAEITPKEKYVENLKEKLGYIASLPKKPIRGFLLPYDDLGYYLVWPSGDYYKLRVWDPDAKDKYRGPSGHTKPVFWASSERKRTLALVEGEANSLSLAEAFPEWDVCSPGSASDFKTDKTRRFLLTYCTSYCTIVIVTDRDGPGTEAAIHAKGLLIGKVPNIPIILMEQDANEILIETGKDALRQRIKESLSNLPRGDDKT